MAEARKIALPIKSGIVLNDTAYEAQGKYITCDHVRFVDGKPEKIGGWEQWNEAGTEFTGICRAIKIWQDFNSNIWHCFGTTTRLWVYDQNKARYNITPYESSGTIANPFTTTISSTSVNVAHTSHGVQIGQYVNFSGASAVGGITISGEYTVTTVVDDNNFTITHSSAATSSAGPGGGASVSFAYEIEAGNANLFYGGGWGIGFWGKGTWNTVRASTSYIQLPRYWSFDTYGQYLLAMPTGGKLYQWTIDTATRAAVVTNSPTSGQYMFVTAERIVVVLGADGDFMKVSWSDDDDNTVWTPADDNTANSRKLQEGSRLVAGTRVGQGISVIWTDTSLYLMQFTGTNTVYSTRVVGRNCGLIGPGGFVVVDGTVFWMSPLGFYMYSGQLATVPRWQEIRPIVDDLNETQRFKTSCFYNQEFREVWWVYPSLASSEPDKYVAVNLETWDWIVGTMDRTAFAAENNMGLTRLFSTSSAGVIYEHETGVDADGLALDWYLETGYMDIDTGNQGANIDGYIPDFMRQVGDIDVTVTTKDLPEDTDNLDIVTKTIAGPPDTVYPGGPTGSDTIVDMRAFGRQVKVKLSQTDIVGGDFALGAQRLEITGVPTKRHD